MTHYKVNDGALNFLFTGNKEKAESLLDSLRDGEIETFSDVREYFLMRREYLRQVRKADDFMYRSQKATDSIKRIFYLDEFSWALDEAESIAHKCPQVWLGEI